MTKVYYSILNARHQGFRAGGVIIKNNKILLMHQILGKEDFYTLPGGTWENGETLEQTCKREIYEEFGIDVDVDKLLFLLDTDTRIAFYFLCHTNNIDIKLGGPEKERMDDHEKYYVEWLDLKDIDKVNFVPKTAKKGIKKHIKNPNGPVFFVCNN